MGNHQIGNHEIGNHEIGNHLMKIIELAIYMWTKNGNREIIEQMPTKESWQATVKILEIIWRCLVPGHCSYIYSWLFINWLQKIVQQLGSALLNFEIKCPALKYKSSMETFGGGEWFCWFYSLQCCIESLRLCSITFGSSMGGRMLPLWKLSATIKPDTHQWAPWRIKPGTISKNSRQQDLSLGENTYFKMSPDIYQIPQTFIK